MKNGIYTNVSIHARSRAGDGDATEYDAQRFVSIHARSRAGDVVTTTHALEMDGFQSTPAHERAT